MATILQLDLIVPPSYNVNLLAVTDASVYPDDPPIVSAPSIEIEIPSFGTKILPFKPLETNEGISISILGADTIGGSSG